MKAGALASQQTPWKRKAFKSHSRFYSSPGFTLHRFSQHFKGSIFVQPREECKLASCFQRRDINPERAAGLTEEVERRTRSWGAKLESPYSARPALSAHTKGTALKPLQKGRATVPLSMQTASYKYPPRLEVQRIQQLALKWKLQLTEQASFSLSLPEPRKELKGPKASTTKPVSKSPTTSGWVARGELPLSSILATEPFLNSALRRGPLAMCSEGRPGKLSQEEAEGRLRLRCPSGLFKSFYILLKFFTLQRLYGTQIQIQHSSVTWLKSGGSFQVKKKWTLLFPSDLTQQMSLHRRENSHLGGWQMGEHWLLSRTHIPWHLLFFFSPQPLHLKTLLA